MNFILNLFLLITLCCSCAICANILGVFYIPYLSHYMLGHTLMKELARRGHNVTMLSSYPSKEPIANYTDISTEDLLDLGKELTVKTSMMDRRDRDLLILNVLLDINEKVFENKNLQNLIKQNNKFDLIIYDAPIGNSLLGLSHRFNAPSVLFNPLGDMPLFTKYTGNYYPLSYLQGDAAYDLTTFLGRLQNVVKTFTATKLFFTIFYDIPVNNIHLKHLPGSPPLVELHKSVSLLLTNTHFTYEPPRPYTPNVIGIGGFNLVQQKPIQNDLKNWLDSAEDGVILVSYGSGITGFVFDDNKIRVFLNVFSKLKQKILWKFDINDIKNKTNIQKLPDNIKFQNWIQQKEILNHPNVKLFITHVGMGALTEAIYGGVPMIGTPFFPDQERNVRNMVNYGYGIKLNFPSLSESTMQDAIDEVLHNPKYAEKINKASKMFKNQPINPLDKAMYWIEYVIKYNGADALKPASLKLHDYQHHLLDVVTFLLSIIFSLTYISYYVIRRLLK